MEGFVRSLYIKKKIQGAGMQDIIRQRKCSPQIIIMANCMFSLTQSSASKGSSGNFCGQHQFSITPAFCGEQKMSGYGPALPASFSTLPIWNFYQSSHPKKQKTEQKNKTCRAEVSTKSLPACTAWEQFHKHQAINSKQHLLGAWGQHKTSYYDPKTNYSLIHFKQTIH